MNHLPSLRGRFGLMFAVALAASNPLKAELTLSIDAPPLAPGETGVLSLTVDQAAGVAGADIVISVPEFVFAGPAETTPATSDFLIASKAQSGQIKVAKARGRGLDLSQATILRIPVTVEKTAAIGTVPLSVSLSHFYSDQPALVASRTAAASLTIVAPAPDSDGDGLPDPWELQHFGGVLSDGMADQDGDGMSDRTEFYAATDPRNAASVFGMIKHGKIESPSGPAPIIQWEAREGKRYTIEWSEGPIGPQMMWRRVYNPNLSREENVLSWHDDGSRTLTEPSTIRERYYRVVIDQE